MPARTVGTEYAQLLQITGRLGKRLKYGLTKLEAEALPDEHWRECFTMYTAAMRALGNHAVQAKPSSDEALTDEQYQSELADLARETILGIDDVALEKILAERRTKRAGDLEAKHGCS